MDVVTDAFMSCRLRRNDVEVVTEFMIAACAGVTWRW